MQRMCLVAVALSAAACGRLGFDDRPNGGIDAASSIDARTDADVACRYRDLEQGARMGCAVSEGGLLWCWGHTYGSTPVMIATPSPVVEVAVGHETGCARMENQRLVCFGGGEQGQLGNGGTANALMPVTPTGDPTVIAIEEGERSFCAIRAADNQVLCWGSEIYGELGNGGGPADRLLVPTAIGVTATDLVSGSVNMCATSPPAGTVCWGRGAGGSETETLVPQATALLPHTQLAAHEFVACAVDGGAVTCRGRREYGQLGDGVGTGQEQTVTPVPTGAVEVSVGARSTCATLATGEVPCWGVNPFGQLGTGDFTAGLMPRVVPGLPPVQRVAAGFMHTCAEASGEIWCWGDPRSGKVGTGAPVDAVVGLTALPGTTWTQVSVGKRHGCARNSAGEVWCWGDGSLGALGIGTYDGHEVPVQVQLGFAADGVVTGRGHSCAWNDNNLVCWGDNRAASLGDGTKISSPAPVAVVLPVATAGIAQVAIDEDLWKTCAIVAERVYCWGGADTEPVEIPGIDSARSIAVSTNLVCADIDVTPLDDDVVCVGVNDVGQLGRGTTSPSETSIVPAVLPAGVITNLVALQNGACAIVNADVYCWGQSQATTDAIEPTPIALGLVAAPQALASSSTGLGILTDAGFATFFGGNVVADVVGAQAYAMSSQGIGCAIAGDGTVACVGKVTNGGLGRVGAAQSLSPAPINAPCSP